MLKKEFGITIFMTTHYLEEADALCDRVAIIDHGKIMVIGTPEELKASLGGDIIMIAIKEEADITGLVKKVDHVVDVKRENDVYFIKAENGEVTAPMVIEALRREGHVVTKISLSKPTLNDVYLRFTGKSMRDVEESKKPSLLRR
jgi:ABC-2 type transport system ATP-binding protein